MKKLLISYLIISNIFLTSLKSETNMNTNTIPEWNFMVYMASNNDLFHFSNLNIKQMKKIGSNKNINILVQQDKYGKAESKRMLIEKNNIKIIEKITSEPESISGTTQSLYSFVEWCLKNYTAKHNALILWNHGSGITDPNIWKFMLEQNFKDLYIMNPNSGFFELNSDLIGKKGICFNEVFETYLKNQDLKGVLQKITANLLADKKIEIIGFDACNMGMLEIGFQIKDFANLMVSSEEAEPGTGWNYELVLSPFLTKNLNTVDFSKHIVKSYQKHYEKTYMNFTQSAINLDQIEELEIIHNNISLNLTNLLISKDKEKLFKEFKKIRNSKIFTTSFINKDYIDLQHFYKSLNLQIKNILKKTKNKKLIYTIKQIQEFTKSGISTIQKIVLEKTFCKSTPYAQGIAFYFPTRKIHNSYKKTDFATANSWISFLEEYLKNKNKKLDNNIEENIILN